ncbi:hypothetical protein C8R45DRAFT_924073 [Mycena sanguinolenta]|nr:hypothetical protein C8R45DRAFT_924073 [Mycena sanguinolenta]
MADQRLSHFQGLNRLQTTGYNTGVQHMKPRLGIEILKSLHVRCFIVYAAAFKEEVVPKLASGEFKYTGDVTDGLEKVGDTILAVLKGTNTCKAVVRVADE